MTKIYFLSAFSAIILSSGLYAQTPQRLRTDLMQHTSTEFAGGYALIRSTEPWFSWEYGEAEDGSVARQKASRVLVASSPELLIRGKADMWDSGRIVSSEQNVQYAGKDLLPGNKYYWALRTWDTRGRKSSLVEAEPFYMAAEFGGFSYYPLDKTQEHAIRRGRLFDFGRASFAQLSLRISSESDSQTALVLLGEACEDGGVDRSPQGSIRYAEYSIPLKRGIHDYTIEFKPDKRNSEQNPANNESGVLPVLMPECIGEVFPFRYVELVSDAELLEVRRQSVHVPFDEDACTFECSDSVLNRVWDLCKYSIKATSFTGIYVDGDRERIPYEADALVNQLSHYAVDAEFTAARRTVAHLIDNPTWPTEWILITPTLAWLDYMYTGDLRLLEAYYEKLKAKALLPLRDSNGLISTRTGLLTREVMDAAGFKGRSLRDIVDWPQNGAAGIEKESPGEADGHVMCDYNTVVNCYHYEALSTLSKIAAALGKSEDELFYRGQAELVRDAVNSLLLDKDRGVYRDGIGTEHSSLHSNMFAMAFGLVPQEYLAPVTEYIKSRRMACSVYGAQFLLDALYDQGEDEYALSLMNSTALRSWYNMIRMGSTITTEAWDNVYKPNLDWNHAWGAVPANVIVRKLMGIEPLEPGFAKVKIHPQPGGLQWASLRYRTIKGDIHVSFRREADGSYTFDVKVPENVEIVESY